MAVPAGAPRRSLLLAAAVVSVVGVMAAPASGRSGPAGVEAEDPALAHGLQWNLERIGAREAWQHATGEGTVIAVVDSGADLTHEDLADRVVASVSCIGAAGDPARCGTGSPADDNGHGTHAAGVAAAHTGNGAGIAGVAPGARIMVVRVLRNDCRDPADPASCTASGTVGDVVAGIRWATQHGADVVNLSLGGGTLGQAERCSFCDALGEAWDAGVVPVVASGNDVVLPPGFDTDVPAVVVSASTRDDLPAPYADPGADLLRRARWSVAAPGGEAERDPADCAPGGHPRGILSTYVHPGERDGYACLAGTSMAAPHVSGSVAVLLSLGHSPEQAVERLLATADDLGPPGPDPTFGAGRINLGRAVTEPPEPRPPSSTPVGTPPATTPTSVDPTEAPEVAPPTTTPPAVGSPDLPATGSAEGVAPADTTGSGADVEEAAPATAEQVTGSEDLAPALVAAATAMVLGAWAAVATGWAVLRRRER